MPCLAWCNGPCSASATPSKSEGRATREIGRRIARYLNLVSTAEGITVPGDNLHWFCAVVRQIKTQVYRFTHLVLVFVQIKSTFKLRRGSTRYKKAEEHGEETMF